jgi:hypothetical protein
MQIIGLMFAGLVISSWAGKLSINPHHPQIAGMEPLFYLIYRISWPLSGPTGLV